ncbi:MAG TPA: DinB family protein [Fibrobacteria bacterium]|nr:DinB family protein [Fibrobacteria bacterium]
MSQDIARSGSPAFEEWSPFHRNSYARLAAGDDVTSSLETQLRLFLDVLAEVPLEQETFRYAPGKWSLREVVGHIADTERILTTRALAAARGDRGAYPTFDEESYVPLAGHDGLPMSRLVEQVETVRRSSLSLFSTFDHHAWRRLGNTSGSLVSARAWAFALLGHTAQHLETIRSKYLTGR